ncbi:MAG: hypothetical protein FGM61_04535, partial [Sediminibacterium sp.]|nr:hypothetical protein [Sediminibacterium sp.]
VYVSRKINSVKGFAVANRSIPLYVSTATVFATWFGSESILGIPGAFLEHGVVGMMADPIAASLYLILVGLFLAKRFYKMNVTTIAEYFKKHKYSKDIQQLLFDLLGNVILFRDEKKQDHYHFRISIQDTLSYRYLNYNEKNVLDELSRRYFYENQNELWYNVALTKLDALKNSSDMLICAEDLGMVPEMVEGVLKSREMLALQVQRMPKKSTEEFAHPANAPYLSVVTPSTHDMSTIRGWWEEDREKTAQFYHTELGQSGDTPYYCEAWINKAIVVQHLYSPAMWCVFQIQDLLGIDALLRRTHPEEERINIPADPNHYWNYRMHITLESLLEAIGFNDEVRYLIKASGRS